MPTSARIVYMGTPEFAVGPLRALVAQGYRVAAVVTAPDRPAGRGQKLLPPAVKSFALQHDLPVLQPERLTDPQFLQLLAAHRPDLVAVVAFRMLPEPLWRMAPLGTFNLHASLLPNYRGAAPINWAIINGETETGLTTFLIDQHIDTGPLLFQERVPIPPQATAGELHDLLMARGGPLVLKTIDALAQGGVNPIAQSAVASPAGLRPAPKLFRPTCRLQWAHPARSVHNLVRGLSPLPGAWTELVTPDGSATTAKILRTQLPSEPSRPLAVGQAQPHGQALRVGCGDGPVEVLEIQLAGRRPLPPHELLRGLPGDAPMRFY